MCIIGKGRTFVLTDGTTYKMPETLCTEVLTQFEYGKYRVCDFKCPVIKNYSKNDVAEMIVSYYLQKALEGGDSSPFWGIFYKWYMDNIKNFPCKAWSESWVKNLGYEDICKTNKLTETHNKIIKSMGITGDGEQHLIKKHLGKLSTHVGVQSSGRGITFLAGFGFKF